MKITINMDDGIAPKEAFSAPLIKLIEQNLIAYSCRIRILKAHFSEEMDTDDDRRCMMEVRISSFKAIRVTSTAETYKKAVQKATVKIIERLHDLFFRSQN